MTADDIRELHRVLCVALGIPVLRMTMNDERVWAEFTAMLACLDETEGGPVSPRDVQAVVALMQKQRREGTPWSLRYAKIMRDPETFRDLVLETRKVRRPRLAVERVERVQADGARVLDERDPAAEAEPRPIQPDLQRWLKEQRP